MEAFEFQYRNISIYQAYCKSLKVSPELVESSSQIPFLPITFFKSHKIIKEGSHAQETFFSSRTSGTDPSIHYVSSIDIYRSSFLKAFELNYGSPKNWCILALLPSYLEREGSSLVFMCDELIRISNHPLSGFYLDDYEKLSQTISQLISNHQPTILIGVTYALLDFSVYKIQLPGNFIVMETGGMKGRRKELVKEEVHEILCKNFQISTIHSEYGMTELLSQAYSKSTGKFTCPPWMKVYIREFNDPFSRVSNGKSGGINIIDLANIYSCCFIETKDLGKLHPDNTFEVLGRFDNSDIRGCNLMVQF